MTSGGRKNPVEVPVVKKGYYLLDVQRELTLNFFPTRKGFDCISLTVKVTAPGIPQLGRGVGGGGGGVGGIKKSNSSGNEDMHDRRGLDSTQKIKMAD